MLRFVILTSAAICAMATLDTTPTASAATQVEAANAGTAAIDDKQAYDDVAYNLQQTVSTWQYWLSRYQTAGGYDPTHQNAFNTANITGAGKAATGWAHIQNGDTWYQYAGPPQNDPTHRSYCFDQAVDAFEDAQTEYQAAKGQAQTRMTYVEGIMVDLIEETLALEALWEEEEEEGYGPGY